MVKRNMHGQKDIFIFFLVKQINEKKVEISKKKRNEQNNYKKIKSPLNGLNELAEEENKIQEMPHYTYKQKKVATFPQIYGWIKVILSPL